MIKIDQIKLAEICREYGVEYLGLFGSVARGEDGPGSDVDLLVRFARESRTSLLGMVAMEGKISQLLNGRKVDLVTEGFLSPFIRDGVMSDVVKIYG